MRTTRRIVFAADGKSAFGDLVKARALSYDFDWQDSGPNPDITNGGIVLIGDRTWLDRMLCEREVRTRRRFVGREDEICYESFYDVDIGCEKSLTRADACAGESLLDWMLTEVYCFDRNEFLFVASEDLAVLHLELFSMQINDVADGLRKIIDRDDDSD